MIDAIVKESNLLRKTGTYLLREKSSFYLFLMYKSQNLLFHDIQDINSCISVWCSLRKLILFLSIRLNKSRIGQSLNKVIPR